MLKEKYMIVETNSMLEQGIISARNKARRRTWEV